MTDTIDTLFSGVAFMIGAAIADEEADQKESVEEILRSAFDFWIAEDESSKAVLAMPVREFLLKVEVEAKEKEMECPPWADWFRADEEMSDIDD